MSLAPVPALLGHPSEQSQAHAKILARKPTPFNADLASAIKNSGLSAAIMDDDIDANTKHNASSNNSNGNGVQQQHVVGDHPMGDNDVDALLGAEHTHEEVEEEDEDEEEEVDEEDVTLVQVPEQLLLSGNDVPPRQHTSKGGGETSQ